MGLWSKLAMAMGIGRAGNEPGESQKSSTQQVPPTPSNMNQPNRMGSLSVDRPIRRINIGLDFGTSTTKVIVRIEEPTGRPLFRVVGPSDQRDTVLYPSVIALADGHLCFGHSAVQSASDVKAASFKMNLPAEAGSRQHAWRGRFCLGDSGLSAEEASTLYVAWVLNDVLSQLRNAYAGSDLRVTVNAAAPLDHLRQEESLHRLFHRIFFRALKMHSHSAARWSLVTARTALRQVHAIPIPTEEESPISVFPETHAAMTSYILVPGRARGKYATVDVGAGSTDVAFFWFHHPDGSYAEGPPEMCYFGAATDFVGMDDVDQAVALRLGVSLSEAKERREQKQIDISVVDEVREVFSEMFNCYRRAFGESYGRCAGEYEWRYRGPGETGPQYPPDGYAKFTLCIVGGGGLSAQLIGKLQKTFPMHNINNVDVRVLRVSDGLHVLRAGNKLVQILDVAPLEQPLLILAQGLAHRGVDIPVFSLNHRFDRVREAPERPTAEDIYG